MNDIEISPANHGETTSEETTTNNLTASQSSPDDVSPDDASPDEMSPEQLNEAKEYGRQKLVCSLVGMVLDWGFLTLFAFLLAPPLDDWLQLFAPLENPWLRLPALLSAMILAQAILSLPLAFYSGYILEHKYNLSRQSFGRWLRRRLKQGALATIFALVLLEGLYFVIRLTQSYWWLAGAAAAFLVSVVLGQLAPVLILPLFYKIKRLDDSDLAKRFQQLSEGTGLAIEGVYRMELSAETVKANAMHAGLGRTRRVILGDTLLDKFSPEEIEIVLAHEIGHHVYRHIPKLIAMGLVLSLTGFFLADQLMVRQLAADAFGSATNIYGNLSPVAIPIILWVMSTFSLFVEPVKNAVSRRFERQCDRYALRRVQNSAAYTRAFQKLAKLNKADPNPHPWEVFFFHDHPPIRERLAMAHTEGA